VRSLLRLRSPARLFLAAAAFAAILAAPVAFRLTAQATSQAAQPPSAPAQTTAPPPQPPAAEAHPPEPERIIFDTDSAYFNDDGAALVMLLNRPEATDVVGVTIVPGNMWPRPGAEAMFRILDVMKRANIPLSQGAQAPLVHTRGMAERENQKWGPIEYLGAMGVDPVEAGKKVPQSSVRRVSHHHAADFMIDTIENATVPVTILALGPMTNLAIALRLHPDLEKKIHRLVFMGGAVHVKGTDNRAAEFNFWFDPEAAQIVLRSGIQQKTMFGLDICNHARLDKSHYDQIAAEKTPITAMFRQDLRKRFDKNPDAFVLIWDCLAAGYLIDPAFVTKTESAYLDVDTTFGPNYGAVVPLDRTLAPEATPVDVMLDLDFERFFEMYKRLLTRAPGL
jgi:inosine-uridine nucleoside N-ribohydrolase